MHERSYLLVAMDDQSGLQTSLNIPRVSASWDRSRMLQRWKVDEVAELPNEVDVKSVKYLHEV